MIDRKIDNLVTLGTPIRGDYKPNFSNIANHINVYNDVDPVQISGGGQTSVSALLGRAFGKRGEQIGKFLSFGEFGFAGRKASGATNINATGADFVSPVGAHSNLWQSPKVWSMVNNTLKSSW
jgi:hypothetical protein